MGPQEKLHAGMTLTQAFDVWIARRIMKHATLVTNARYISERTEWDYRQYYRALDKFFLGMTLGDIHQGNLEAYHHDRAFCEGAWTRQAGANRIRKEISMLIRILREAGCWSEAREEGFDRLQAVESDVPRAMTPDEQMHFLQVAGSKDEYAFIYAYTIVALQTTASTNELRELRIGDVMLSQGVLNIRRAAAKNRFRIRTIPIETQEVRFALESLIWRAQQLGAAGPHHYLFPLGGRGGHWYDPSRPMSDSGLKKRWDDVRVAAGLPWLRPYDLRHTAITRLAEEGVAIPTILSFAGHISTKMQQHYTTISMTAKRKAMASTWSAGVPKPSWGITSSNPMQNLHKKVS
jgi:integrase